MGWSQIGGRSQMGGMVSDGSQKGQRWVALADWLRRDSDSLRWVSVWSQMSGMVSNGEVSGLGLGFA